MRSDTSAKLLTHQDESSRIAGHKSDGRKYKYNNGGKEVDVEYGQISNWLFDTLGHKGKNHSTNSNFRPRRMASCPQ